MRLMLLTLLAMLAFAGNSMLCRLALAHTSIDAASFTTPRRLSGALMLGLLVWPRPRAACALQRPRTSSRHPCRLGGDWPSALALFAYAAAFSFAYGSLSTGTGALLLFGAVQATMIMAGLWTVGWGAARRHQTLGLLMAIAGLIVILLPGLTAPPLGSATVMLGSGVAGLEGRFLINIFIQGDIL